MFHTNIFFSSKIIIVQTRGHDIGAMIMVYKIDNVFITKLRKANKYFFEVKFTKFS